MTVSLCSAARRRTRANQPRRCGGPATPASAQPVWGRPSNLPDQGDGPGRGPVSQGPGLVDRLAVGPSGPLSLSSADRRAWQKSHRLDGAIDPERSQTRTMPQGRGIGAVPPGRMPTGRRPRCCIRPRSCLSPRTRPTAAARGPCSPRAENVGPAARTTVPEWPMPAGCRTRTKRAGFRGHPAGGRKSTGRRRAAGTTANPAATASRTGPADTLELNHG